MSNEIRVNYEETFQAVRQFEAGAQNIETSIQELRARLDGLRGTWMGKAAEDYEVLYQEYDNGARQMNETLRQLTDALNKWTASLEQFEGTAFG